MECLSEDVKKKKGQILYITGRDDQIAWYYEQVYGFNADLIETINLAIIMHIRVV